jgi:hypothetical protein
MGRLPFLKKYAGKDAILWMVRFQFEKRRNLAQIRVAGFDLHAFSSPGAGE